MRLMGKTLFLGYGYISQFELALVSLLLHYSECFAAYLKDPACKDVFVGIALIALPAKDVAGV